MWQKARILSAPIYPEVEGFTLWVKAEPPRIVNTINTRSQSVARGVPRLSTHILQDNTRGEILPMQIDPAKAELLPDFAEDVELIRWEDFLEQCRNQAAEPRAKDVLP